MILKQDIIDKLNKINLGRRKNKDWTVDLNDNELDEIINSVKHLDIYVDDFKEIRDCYINNINVQPICPVCGGKCKYERTYKSKYSEFCSAKCRNSDIGKDIIVKKTKKTNLKNYGVEFKSQLEDSKDNIKQYWDNLSESDIIAKLEKTKKTNLEKYGVENPSQSDEIKEKIKKTNLERYGVENPSQSDEIKEKIKKTNLERYGVEVVFQSNEIKELIKNTNLEKYGVENPSQSDEIKEKSSITNRMKYYKTFKLLLKQKKIEPLFEMSEYLTIDYDSSVKKYKCLICDKEFENNNLNIQKISCPYHKFRSLAEADIVSWLNNESPGLKYVTNKQMYNNGKRYELDIYLPDLNIGIEYHRLYLHSEAHKNKNYHKDKYEFFKSLGIEIVQIFENEWLNSQEIVKSILRTKLGVVERKVYGRSCTIRNIENDEYRQFCELNHIQGYCSAKVKLGLYDKTGELVQIMSFSKPRFNKNYDWENIRTCTLLNTIVVGGFSKLLKYFKNNYPGSIISYVDVRYFNGNGYINNGFTLINHIKPNFFYFKNGDIILESRQKYQKHKLSKIFNNYDSTITAHDNMLQNKFLRIYDAGNLMLTIN